MSLEKMRMLSKPAEPFVDGLLKRIEGLDEVIRVQADHDRLGIAPVNFPGSPGKHRAGAARVRFDPVGRVGQVA